MAAKKEKEKKLEIKEISKEYMEVCVVGTSPIILNRMSEKSKQTIILPPHKTKGHKNKLKHNPYEEYRASAYRIRDEEAPTLIGHKATAFKGAMGIAALDMDGANKTQIGRLVFVRGKYEGLVPIYGVPKMTMDVVRSADIKRTPDIRTRVIIERWAAIMTIEFVTPILNPMGVINLLAAGGITSGIGDWRPEKGKGDFGQYRVANHDDPEFLEIVNTGGRDIQIYGLNNPVPYSLETEDLLAWYLEEVADRGYEVDDLVAAGVV